MKAICIHEFGGPEVLRFEETPDPHPGSGQVVIRVKAAGVNPVDTYIRAGKYGPREFPFTPGSDAAGVIESVGAGVTKFKIGDRVFTDRTINGSYAEKVLCDEAYAHRLPDKTSFIAGASIGVPGGTAYRALFQRGRGIAGEIVLIHGATGGVGTAAIQLARAAGMTVIASAGNDQGKKYVMEQGAHHATDHDVTQRPGDVAALTGGNGFDLILEMLANRNLSSDLKSLAKRGRVVVIGSRGTIEIDPRDTMGREADILGMMLYGATPVEHRQIYSALLAGLESGTYRPMVGLEIPLAKADRAHREVIEGESHGKIVLIA